MADLFGRPPFASAAAPLVGRDAELATLLAVIRGCYQGQPTVILVTGEPGVGKTRLMAEISSRATAELGANVLSGFAIEGGGMPPYFPIGRAIRGAVGRLGRDASVTNQPASLLAMAGLVSSDFPGFRPPATLAPDAERVRLYDAFADIAGATVRRLRRYLPPARANKPAPAGAR
jgi:hypothetical protein